VRADVAISRIAARWHHIGVDGPGAGAPAALDALALNEALGKSAGKLSACVSAMETETE
jgi:hypothetical protein